MRTYDILTDFGLKDEEADRITLNSGCVVAVFRYKNPVSFSRRKGTSSSQNIADAAEVRSSIIIIDDISSATVSSSKTSHITSLNLNLRPGMNYTSEVLPGDYIFCWMVQNREDLLDLKKRLENEEPCNKFNDGLKFFGKVNACRKKFMNHAATGHRAVSHNVSGVGFGEFDASVYFEPYLQLRSVGLATDWLQNYGVRLNEVIAQNGTGISVNKIIPLLLQVFYGAGIPKNRGVPNANADLTEGLDNPNAFVVPTPVGKVFGITQGSKPNGLVAFTDLLEVVHGIQKYEGDRSVTSSTNTSQITDQNNGKVSSNQGVLFQPKGADTDYGSKVHFTGIEQLGIFTPSPPSMSGQKSVWSILNQFLNPTVNEIYTALRTNLRGEIFPTFVLRQLPFSTGLVSESYKPRPIQVAGANTRVDVLAARALEATAVEFREPTTINQTYFAELPRWRIHPIFIRNFDLGRSDALRFNFIHVIGESGAKTGLNIPGAFVRDPPIKDDLDIARSGLRPYMRTVPCAGADIANRSAGAWMYLLSDFLMGQQLTLTGTLELDGIQQPIVPGDNIELDDVLLHIEAVVHTFNADVNGNRKFLTTLSLAHGMNNSQLRADETKDSDLYVGIEPDQLERFSPVVLSDSEIEDSND